MDHEIFEQHHETALSGTDREKQIDHSHDRTFASQHEHAAAARLFENYTQPAQLLVFVRPKIALLGEEFAEHLRQLVQIRLGCRLNDDVLAHR